MTASELIAAIEACGGTLTLHGDKIRCTVPDDSGDLIDSVRAQRDAVFRVLQRRGGSGLPWPSYNWGKQFSCEQCGTVFDTSVGFAKHKVSGCESKL